jgi:hypothetical protein
MKIHQLFILVAFVCTVHATSFVHAADNKQVLSVTPPLFQISTVPGDIWQSSVKIVNGNSYPLTVYAEVVNFEPMGEGGQGRFIPLSKDPGESNTLADWVVINKGPIIVEPERTSDLTFFAEVPKDAAPGGHYAAIMISTEEPKSDGGLAVLASQAVTSLLFLRVEGDVHEEGTIREFSLKDSFLSTPDAAFSLRFENKGNVHLQPRGQIVITNMWGTERGTIPINYQTHFGNVLPKSIRNFSFSWRSDFKFTDIGRYEAEVTLAYGTDGVKSTSGIAHFWVIPVKWTLVTVSVVGIFIWLLVLMVRAYVRRMLELAGVPVSQKEVSQKEITLLDAQKATYTHVAAPIRDGVLDLRRRLKDEEHVGLVSTIVSFALNYKKFFVSLLVLIAIFIVISSYIGRATKEGNTYEIEIREGDASTTLTDTEVEAITGN